MKIGIIGLGLIGGSIAKKLSKENYCCYAMDLDKSVVKAAIDDGVIINELSVDELSVMDINIVATPPLSTIEFIENNIENFGKSIVCDVCGIKEAIYNIADIDKVDYYGLHPMAGKEYGGYNNSTEILFENANMIITDLYPPLKLIKLCHDLGCGNIVNTSPQEHDKIIAYTSGLCHIVSNAFAKSPTALHYEGFSGGSFEDLTRVGRLDAELWKQLFRLNRNNILDELQILIFHLKEYESALSAENYDMLKKLLISGSVSAEKLRK